MSSEKHTFILKVGSYNDLPMNELEVESQHESTYFVCQATQTTLVEHRAKQFFCLFL